jgi:uncharacterized membrane protein
MGTQRLEAFSDGVIAIIITIMVLELKVPHGASFADLRPLGALFASYLVSFTFIAIYWNGHHHMLQLCIRIDARVMWMNMHLLFWLSLIPIVTGWVGENPEASPPAALYGIVLLLAAFAFNLLQRAIRIGHPDDAAVVGALGRTTKGTISEVMYAVGIALAFVHPFLADALYVAVALLWFIPDRKIEAQVTKREHAS